MSQPKRIVIVGGVAGGASAAARARRLSEDAKIIVFERGHDVSFANCGLPYHIGGEIEERKRLLVQTPKSLHARFRIDVHVRHEVVAIDRERREVVVRNLDGNGDGGKEFRQGYDSLVLSPGAEAIYPPIPGAQSNRVLTLRNMADMDAINTIIADKNPKSAVVVGGGYIGLEMVEALRRRGLAVTLVELADQVMGPADAEMVTPLHQELVLHGVDLRLGTSVTEFVYNGSGNGNGEDVLNVLLSSGETLSCGLVVLAVGVRPEVKLAKTAGLEIGSLGGIIVDEHMRTSDPHIFAVGDAVEVKDFLSGAQSLIPLAGPANRQGRITADNIFGRTSTYKKTQGTAICKVFNLAIGMTGMSEKALRRAKIAFEKVYVHPASHAGYYPGAHPVSLKLLFDPKDGRVLGAQAVGAAGVDKRIDVLATAIRAGMSVFDLEELELAYAPPYGSAKDVVNYAGFVAANALRGDVLLCHSENILNPTVDQELLDVRTGDEVASGTIEGAVHVPVDQLRDRLGELSKDKEWLVFCQVGLRGYVACRILMQHGYKCRNLTGGYKTYLMETCTVDRLTATSQCMQYQKESEKVASQSNQDADMSTSNGRGAACIVKQIDACGLQCPGPIQKLKQEIDAIRCGEAVSIVATDPGFLADVPAWCHSTGNELVDIGPDGKKYRATIIKRGDMASLAPSEASTQPSTRKKGLTIVVFSNSFDKAMAAFIIANGAAAMGFEVTMFFTFWGLNVLRKEAPQQLKKTFIERMFAWMMPRGPEKLALSQMHMGGMGLAMIKGIMRNKNVTSLADSIQAAQASGVNLVGCSMSMDLMGIKRAELIDGVEEGGVAMYLDRAGEGNVNLFI